MPRLSVMGHAVDVPIPRPDQVAVLDVARAQARLVRFCGWGTRGIVLAQHTVEVAVRCGQIVTERGGDHRQARLASLAGHLHDWHEAYLGEVVSPIKRVLGDAWTTLERSCDDAIHAAIGTAAVAARYRDVVAQADREMLISDAVRYRPSTGVRTPDGSMVKIGAPGTVPAGCEVHFAQAPTLTEEQAHRAFLTSYESLVTGLCGPDVGPPGSVQHESRVRERLLALAVETT